MDYWTSVINGFCWLIWFMAIIGFISGAWVWLVGTATRSSGSVRSEQWVSGCLRQQDGVKGMGVGIALFVIVIFLPCDHHPQGLCHTHVDGGYEVCHKD